MQALATGKLKDVICRSSVAAATLESYKVDESDILDLRLSG